MFKRIFIGILMFVVIFFIIFQVSGSACGEKDEVSYGQNVILIDDVFNAIGCEWLQVNVNGWAKLNYTDISMDEMERILVGAVKFFEIGRDYDLFLNENGFMRQANMRGMNSDGDVVTVIVSNDISTEDQNEVYVVADIVSADQERASDDMIEKMKGFFGQMEAKPRISTTFTGTFSEEYNENQQERLCIEVFEDLDGEITQVLKEEGLISMAGYSPHLSDKLKTEKGYVNLQVALRYSSYWGKTYIWLGTPVITTEY